MLEDALRIESAERKDGGGGGGGVEAVAAPRTLAYILYVWHSSQLLQSAMLAVPSLAAAVRAVFEPRDDNLAATPCDLELAGPRRAAPRPPRPLPAAANAPSTGPLTLLASLDAHPGGGGGGGPVELAVNHLGVPMFVQKGCAE